MLYETKPFSPIIMLSHTEPTAVISKNAKLLILVASLGYFVDVYDLILFGVVRIPSLKSLGLSGDDLLLQGSKLMNTQMAGMLLGGLLWGILGDKKGRKSVLFGSILLYSLANAANGLVNDIQTYMLLRFVAGVGLAGELGAGVTIVNESLPKEKRGLGALFIAGTGALGAVTAALVAGMSQDPEWWRMTYFVGGGMGLALLLLRLGTMESTLFAQMDAKVEKGNFLQLFTSYSKFSRYFLCILMGLPIWYIVGILVLYAAELSKQLHVQGTILPGNVVICCYLGLSSGDFLSGLVSQWLKSRKQTVYIFVLGSFLFMGLYLFSYGLTSPIFYFICFGLGFSGGYWAVFITMASEQFGTNIRATVTTTVPNFVRGALILINMGFQMLLGDYGLITAALIVGIVCNGAALWAAYQLEETFTKDLDFIDA